MRGSKSETSVALRCCWLSLCLAGFNKQQTLSQPVSRKMDEVKCPSFNGITDSLLASSTSASRSLAFSLTSVNSPPASRFEPLTSPQDSHVTRAHLPLGLSSHTHLLTPTTILKKSEETEMKRKTRRRSSCIGTPEKNTKKGTLGLGLVLVLENRPPVGSD